MKAKYYIYRNLNKGGFSVKYKGKVVDVLHDISATDVTFKVSQKGRNRVINNGVRNVHAFAACNDYSGYPLNHFQKRIDCNKFFSEVKYNPYKNSSFMLGEVSIVNADTVYFTNGRCYI